MDALNRSEVPIETTPNELVAIINTQSRESRITFIDADLPQERSDHNKMLHVTIRCFENTIPAFLADNGSTLICVPSEIGV